jgi:hypothetical protein
VIWSGEHNAYWRPEACGYTSDIKQAGRFMIADANAWARHCGQEKQLEIRPIDAYGHLI